MNNRERTRAVLHYEKYDRMPVVHFGYWGELLQKWVAEGHLKQSEIENYWDNSTSDKALAKKLGFDYGWSCSSGSATGLKPGFDYELIEDKGNGEHIYRNGNGLIEMSRTGTVSIPTTIGTTMTGREAWDNLYKPKLMATDDRVDIGHIKSLAAKQNEFTEMPFGYHVGSLYGFIRDMLGVEGLCYLYADDEELYSEIIDTVANICYNNLRIVLEAGLRLDFAHFWEDICFKNGPLVNPAVFTEYVAPHYKRLTALLAEYGTDIVSLDCDGCIDKLVPIWLENGVNCMFPIEVGTWNASIIPWREKYGKALRGVGGMDKRVFALDYSAVDREIERLKPAVELGGYIPCPDHRLPPETKWENVQYYCDKFRQTF